MSEPRPVRHGSRLAAARALVAVEQGADLERALDRELRRLALEDRRERALASAIAHAAVRHQRRIDLVLERAARRSLARVQVQVRAVLRAAGAQLLVLDGVPEYAAVATAPDLARDLGAARAVGFVNAVLRSVARARCDGDVPAPDVAVGPLARIADELSYPRWLAERWIERFGTPAAEALAGRWNEPATLSLRLAPGVDRERLLTAIRAQGFEASASPWLARAIRVRGAHPAELPGWEQGWFQPQDEASQAVVALLDPRVDETILDLCAGLGTKTSAILEHAGTPRRVVACDRSGARLAAQAAESHRRGDASARVSRLILDGVAELPFREGAFDRVLVDAPCTGVGALRRHPEIKWRRTAADPARLGEIQRAILGNAVRVLRRGGVLVYSTCSTEPEENEDVVRSVLSQHPSLIVESARDWLPAPFAPLVADDGFLRTYPHGEGLDGFFAARLRRSDRG